MDRVLRTMGKNQHTILVVFLVEKRIHQERHELVDVV